MLKDKEKPRRKMLKNRRKKNLKEVKLLRA